MYTYEDFLMLSARYKPKVKSIQDTYYKPKVAFDKYSDLIKASDSVKCYYDDKGNLIKWVNFDTLESCYYAYNAGVLMSIKQYMEGVLKLINILTYDHKNRIIAESINEPQKTPISKSQFITCDYDKPYMVLKRSYSFGFSYDYLHTKIFNNQNQKIEDKIEDLDGVMQHTKHHYNQKGQIIKDVILENDEISYVLKLTYYSNGLLQNINKDYFKYKIDKKGNFIEKTRYCEFGLSNVRKRAIEYY